MTRQETYEYIKQNIRPATLKDEFGLERFSHSKLETFHNCPYRYYLHYEKNQCEQSDSIALELGHLFHEIMEERGRVMLGELNMSIDTQEVKDRWEGKIKDVKRRRWDEWIPDKDGVTYDEKIERFWSYYPTSILDVDWKPLSCEQEFHFVWKNKLRGYGFIDRLDINKEGEIRVTDYKTSRAVYSKKSRDYAQQMAVYAMACVCLYDKLPTNFEYDFIFLNERASAMEREDSIIQSIDNIDELVDEIFSAAESRKFFPAPKPLCHWCDFCATNDRADREFKSLCSYYSKWTREKKDFGVHEIFDKETFNADEALEKALGTASKKTLVW